jgi:Protein of unknown function (DUF3102).
MKAMEQGYVPITARRINLLHAAVERHCRACSDSIYAGLKAAWHAGRLLLAQKRKVAHGNWQIWLERYFDGTPRTAQRYMALAKAVPDVTELKGFTLRQAYLRLGIAVAGRAVESRCVVLPMHAVLMNRFQRWLHQKGDTAALPEPEKQTLRRDLRPLYDWLSGLFADDRAARSRAG